MQYAIEAGASIPENVAWAYVQLGNLEFNMGHLDEAAKQYDTALNTFANYQMALAGNAQVAAARGDLAKAATLYQQAFEQAPLPAYAIALGDIYTNQGDMVKAKQQFDLVLAIDKLYTANGSITDMEISLFEADHGLNMADTLKRAKAAYAARPSIHAADALAWALYKNGQVADAQKYSSEALKLGTRDSLKLYHAGVIQNAAGNLPQARADLEQVATLNPQFSLLYEDDAAKTLTDLRANPAAALAAQKY
jgi:tetratricopeptide (TPR) repeat protein